MNKRIFVVLLILVLTISVTLNAKKSTLIDFNKLKANGYGIAPSASLDKDNAYFDRQHYNVHWYGDHDPRPDSDADKSKYGSLDQHMPTLVDYSSIAGSNYTEEEKAAMNTSLACYNWKVSLNSSAKSVENTGLSYCIEWHTRWERILDDATIDPRDSTTIKQKRTQEGFTILGVRIHFPENQFNNWAIIKPAFEIPAYEDISTNFKGEKYVDIYKDNEQELRKKLKEGKGIKYENGYGVVRNVGIIKTMTIRVYGCQFKNSLSILLKDENGVVTEYNMPQYLDFDGWRKITWKNPNYIEQAANRDLHIVPLYPRNMPFVKLDAFRIYRQGDQYGGDFVTYIKDVVLTYDQAVLERKIKPIEHEEAWGILETRTENAKQRELSRIGQHQILQYLESRKMDKTSTSE